MKKLAQDSVRYMKEARPPDSTGACAHTACRVSTSGVCVRACLLKPVHIDLIWAHACSLYAATYSETCLGQPPVGH